MIDRCNIKEGQIVFFLERSNMSPHDFYIGYGVVDFYSCTDVCVDWLGLKDNRIVVTLDGKRTPFAEFKNDTEYRKLPKGWTYNTKLYDIEYDESDKEIKNKIISLKGIDKQVRTAYDCGILVKKTLTDYEGIDATVDKDGYKLSRKLPMWVQHRTGGTYRYNELFATFDEAQEALDAYKAEQTRIANLSDREWVLEDVHKTVNRHKNIYHESDEYYEKVLDFFENRCDNIEDVEIRIYGGVIQWKYYNRKKWNSL
jgi:hypothetical protein